MIVAADAAVEGPAIITIPKSGKIVTPFDDRYRAMQAEIDAIEKTVGIETTSLIQSGYVQNAIHTGVLMYDLTVGGGAAPGRMTILPGLEGSGKSTIVDNLAAVCALQQIPIFWFDAEGALDPNYVGRIFSRYGLRIPDLMGIRNPKTGKWDVPPLLRYSQDSIGEHVFKTIAHICHMLPFIKQNPADRVWYRTHTVKGKPTTWVPDERQGKPQYLFIVDSWPALLPEAINDNPDSSPMAANARMISAGMPLIKSPIAQKNCALFSVNQIRTRPGVTMGNPQYEPCGLALGFFSDIRTQIMKVAPSTIGAGKGQYTEEPSINGGVDKYVYAKLKNTKNKAFTPFREGSIRVRFEHDSAPGDGICRTWDIMQYLLATGQAIPRVNQRLEMHLRPVSEKARAHNMFEEGKTLGRAEFKTIVEAPQYKQALYQHCLQQIRSGYAFDIERESVFKAIEDAKSSMKTSAALEGDLDFGAGGDEE